MASRLPKRGLSLESLRALCEVAEAGSESAAAAKSGYSRTRYSFRIGELEEHFGVDLVQRGGKAKLTQVGKALAKLSNEFLVAFDDFSARCKKAPTELRIGTSDSLICWAILPKLHDIQKALDRVKIVLPCLDKAEVLAGLRDFSIDFGLIRADETLSHHKREVLGSYSYCLVVPNVMAPHNIENDLGWLSEVPLVVTKADWVPDFEKTVHGADRVTLKVQVVCESFPMAPSALATGQYGAILPTLAWHCLDSNRFKRVEPDFLRAMKNDIVLTWNERITLIKPWVSKAIKALSKHLKWAHDKNPR